MSEINFSQKMAGIRALLFLGNIILKEISMKDIIKLYLLNIIKLYI